MPRGHRTLFVVMLIAGALSLALGWITVTRHADAVRTVAAVQLDVQEVRIRPEDPHNPLSLRLRASNQEGLPYHIDNIRLVARVNGDVAGTLPRQELAAEVPPQEPLTFDVHLDPGTAYAEPEELAKLRDTGRADWYVDGFMEIRPPQGRALERWDFAVGEVGVIE